MFVVFYTANIVYICVFMTCSTYCCVCETLMDPFICMCIYICVCVYACMYVKYVCMYIVSVDL
jgi:hypothetical protein